MKSVKLFVVALSPAIMAVACSIQNSQNISSNANTANTNTVQAAPAPQSTPATADIADGKKLYTDNCAACHRENGTGGKMEFEGKRINPDNLTSDKLKKAPDDKIADTVREGVEDDGMPAFADKLSDSQINAIIGYIRSDLQKLPTPAR